MISTPPIRSEIRPPGTSWPRYAVGDPDGSDGGEAGRVARAGDRDGLPESEFRGSLATAG